MAFRSDISIRWDLSPRLITVAAPSTELVIQDLHDTLRELEAQQQNLIYESIIETTGGQDLGGSVTVGLTAQLLNACVSFEARTQNVSDGYATNIDITGTILTDSTATFVSDGVERGALLVNFIDFSVATVIQVLSETQIEITLLDDGLTDVWFTGPPTNGDYYKIWNQITCNVTGGNLVAVDANNNPIEPICPTAMVQVVRTASSSATSTFSKDIEFASFNGGVTVDINNITGNAAAGTKFPAGTIRQPCNNFEDALEILHTRGFDTLFIKGNATVTSGLIYDNITFIGQSIANSKVTITDSASVIGCEFSNMNLLGILDGYSTIKNSDIGSLIFFNGLIEDSGLSDTIILGGGTQGRFINCHNNMADQIAEIDCGGSGQSLVVRGFIGGLKISNKTGTDPVSIDMLSGQIIIDSTVINGEIILRGIGNLIDNSTDNAIINVIDLIQGSTIQRLSYQGIIWVDSSVTNTSTVIGVDGISTNPVSDLKTAFLIDQSLDFKSFNIEGIISLPEDKPGYRFFGNSRGILQLDGYTIDGGSVMNLGVQGIMGNSGDSNPVTGTVTLTNVFMLELRDFAGLGDNCVLGGELSLRASSKCLFRDLVVDERINPNPFIINSPAIDVNGAELVIQGMDGYMTIKNVNLPVSSAIITTNGGVINIDSSCTDGDIIIRGFGTVINQGTSTLTTSDLVDSVSLSKIPNDVFKKLFPFVVD